MTMFRMPIFCWNILATSVLILIAFPVLTAALFCQLADRVLGAHAFDPANGGAILWQHLFWFFGHPEVYIVALPFFGIVTEIIPVFSRKPLFGYKGMVFATIAIRALSAVVWAHHMFATGAVLLAFFSLTTYLIAIPTGIKFVNWIGTMWKAKISFETPMLFSVGFLVTFLLGGLTGILLAAPPLDFHLNETYFVVAHFHYVLFGTIVFSVFAGIYFWFPKMTGRMLDETLGKIHFWTMFIGFHLTFLVQHWLGNEGMPRRYIDYLPTDGFTTLHAVSSIGAFLLGASTLPFLWNVFRSYRFGRVVHVDDPWGFGNSLEWATSSPPPRHNFTEMPRIRSERPAFELHYPHYVERFRTEAHVGGKPSPYEMAAQAAGPEHQPPRTRGHDDGKRWHRTPVTGGRRRAREVAVHHQVDRSRRSVPPRRFHPGRGGERSCRAAQRERQGARGQEFWLVPSRPGVWLAPSSAVIVRRRSRSAAKPPRVDQLRIQT